MDQPILTKKTLLNYLILNKPGTYTCKVAATVRSNHAIQSEDPYYVVYLRAIEAHKYEELLKLLEEHVYLNYASYSKYFISGVIYANQVDKDGYDLPTKGESVRVTFNSHLTHHQIVSNIELIPREELKRIDPEDVFDIYNLFKTYFNEKSDNQQDIPDDDTGKYPVPEL